MREYRPACHVALWSHYAGMGEKAAFVRVGTIEDPDACPPQVHIFARSEPPWVVLPESPPVFEIYYNPADDLVALSERMARRAGEPCAADRRRVFKSALGVYGPPPMSNLIDRWFAEHPRSVGESYVKHFLAACRFGLAMLSGGLACLVHALVPALFERTGSRTVKRLYSEMVARQPGMSRPAYEEPSWRPEYEI